MYYGAMGSASARAFRKKEIHVMGKKTVLYDEHLNLGARIVEFGGYDMPVQYSSAIEEHNAVRKTAGMFDVSHMGEFSIKGRDSRSFLSGMIPTSMSKLEKNKGMYSCLCRDDGGIIDDIFVFMIDEDDYFLVVNAGTKDKDYAWLEKHLKGDVVLRDITDETAKIDIQGPSAFSIITKIFDRNFISSLERFYFDFTEYNGQKIMISNTGYTGEAGFELYIDRSEAVHLWKEILEKGNDEGIIPCGLASRDSLRLEACYSLYGHELSEEINPVEAGLTWLVSNESDFIGSDAVRAMKEKGAERRIYCISMTGKGIPREGYKVEKDGSEIGYLTSGGFSPVFSKGIALAMLGKGSVKTGDTVDIVIRNKKVEAEVVKRPFYSFNG